VANIYKPVFLNNRFCRVGTKTHQRRVAFEGEDTVESKLGKKRVALTRLDMDKVMQVFQIWDEHFEK
jgi:hypothetical protein